MKFRKCISSLVITSFTRMKSTRMPPWIFIPKHNIVHMCTQLEKFTVRENINHVIIGRFLRRDQLKCWKRTVQKNVIYSDEFRWNGNIWLVPESKQSDSKHVELKINKWKGLIIRWSEESIKLRGTIQTRICIILLHELDWVSLTKWVLVAVWLSFPVRASQDGRLSIGSEGETD